MLITFRSSAGGDVIMLGDVAKQLLEIMGKAPDAQGIVTVEQLPQAIARLRRAAAESKARQTRTNDEQDEDAEADQPPAGVPHPTVSLAQRIVPLIELLEYSLEAETPVLWNA